MTNPREPQLNDRDWDRINALVDGELAGEALDAFRRELDQRPELLEAARSAGAVDASLSDMVRRETRDHAPHRFPTARWRKLAPLTIAAAVLIAGALVLRSVTLTTEQRAPIITNVAAVYDRYADRERPTVVCDTPEKFVAYTREAFGRRISADFNAGVAFIGWVYPDDTYRDRMPVTGRRILLSRAPDGTPVIAVFQPRGWPAPQDDGTLKVKSIEIAGIGVHEIGPGEEPAVVALLSAD